MFIRRIVQAWFNRKGEIEGTLCFAFYFESSWRIVEKTLRELRKTQQTKIEEIKKKTNYYSTRDLLQRYDQSSGNSPMQTPRRPNDGGPSKNNNNNPQKTPVLRSSPAQLPPSRFLLLCYNKGSVGFQVSCWHHLWQSNLHEDNGTTNLRTRFLATKAATVMSLAMHWYVKSVLRIMGLWKRVFGKRRVSFLFLPLSVAD